MSHFAEVCTEKPGELQITPAQAAEIQAATDAVKAHLQAVFAARAALEAAITGKDLAVQASTKKVREFAQKFRVNQYLDEALLPELGLAPRYPAPSNGVLKPPVRLFATANPVDASVLLKWNRNGCTQGTNFLIEHSINGGPWKGLTATTRTRFTVQNVIPGLPRLYRITAHRARKQTGPSNVASVYDNGIGAQQLAA